MLHKARSPFKGYERSRLHLKYKHLKLPNAPFYGRDDLPTYGSYKKYYNILKFFLFFNFIIVQL